MFSTIKLRSLAVFITCILSVYLCFSVFESNYQRDKLFELQNEWDYYRGYQSERIRLRAHLISALGYGGLIHIYDNYILRKTDSLKRDAWKSFGYVKSIIEDLERLSKSEGERASLDDIIVFVDQLGANLLTIEQGINNGLSSIQIYDSVDNVNFRRTDRALKRLGEELLNQSPEMVNEKSNLSVKMRSLIGINGMIQYYKDYLILGFDEDAKETLFYINEIKLTAQKYLDLQPGLGERIAIEDILYTIEKYERNVSVIEEKLSNDFSTEEIDAVVNIDDSIALRGFELLEAEKINQIEPRANAVASLINSMELEQSIYSIFQFIFLVTLIFLLNFIMRTYVIKPIQNISDALKRLSEGDLEVDLIKNENKDNEIGQLESAFKIFKLHEIERRESEDKLREMAMTDNLTGLANRVQLESRYSELIAIAKRKQELVATMMIDLDNFKVVNDTFGHATGDKLLQTFSEILTSEFRETDIISRIGGDEFVVILYAPETENDVAITAQRLIDKIVEIEPISGTDIRVGTSIGIVIESSNHSDDINHVLERADKALYQAKETGKNKYVYHADVLKFKNSVRQTG